MKKLSTTLFAVVIASALFFKACDEVEQLIAVLGIELNQTAVTLPVGATLTLVPTVSPADASNPAINWTSTDTTVATISGGTIRAIAPGTTIIMAITVDGGRIASTSVTVYRNVPATGVTLNQTSATLTLGSALTLTATVLPDSATNQNVTWSSNDIAVATVSNNGIVTAVSVGTATITVSTEDGNRTATCVITVTAPVVSVTDITLSLPSATLFAGDTLRLTANVQPANATNRDVIWSSSNTTVATVHDGRVTAVAPGSATIAATTQDGGRTVTCEITVVPVPVASITLDRTTATVTMGNRLTLMPTVLPINATNRTVTWTSSDTSVATVDNGVVTPVSNGMAIITATTEDGERTAACVVTVITSVASISLSYTTASLITNETLILVPTILPATATNRTVIWTSSDQSVATVSNNGVVTAVSAGTATIRATTQDGNRTATCVVTVYAPVTGVTLPATSAVYIGVGTITLTATILPADATNRTVTWSSSDTSVATVNNNGFVVGISAGTATITVTTQDGNHTASSVVTVSPHPMRGCNSNTPGWGAGSLGASFASNQTWTIPGTDGRPTQVWSDAVVAAACANRTAFSGGNVNTSFNADCRSSIENNNFTGHYFSWCAVYRFADQLCPPQQGWRVPTKQDFIDLDMNMGGTGQNGQQNQGIGTFIGGGMGPNGGLWGGARYTGTAGQPTAPFSQYWSLSEYSIWRPFNLRISWDLHPQSTDNNKNSGLAVRCVR